ncbi:MAG: response regulator [Tahibacter sp.]
MAAPLMSGDLQRMDDEVEAVNILLVDDKAARLLSYRSILEPLAQNLIEANSGTEALRLLMERDFALILLDVNMPDMDGFETAATIHQHPRFEKTPIIFVSAINVTDFDRLRGYKLGAVDYVLVPVIPEILRSKVGVLVELFRKRRELQISNLRLADANAELAHANAALHSEKNREVHRLNQTLQLANEALEKTNSNLHAEVAERSRAEQRLQDADRRKDEFLATLAHELRNPLAPIQSALGVRRLMQPRDQQDAELQGVMERQLRHMVRLIDDLLDVSRITRDRLELRLEEVRVIAALETAIELAKPLMLDANQHLHLNFSGRDCIVRADEQRLAQIFANILNNASKYTPSDGNIWLDCQADTAQVTVSVRDSGIGIEADKLDVIFDLFRQIDTSLERARGGLGIGLTLVRRLVSMHGGTVQAYSDGIGAGSNFVVNLPLCLCPALPASEVQTPVARSLQRLRIYVIDDNRDAADMLALSLSTIGHDVRTCYASLSFVALASAFLPDLIFMDVGMPHLNGFELAPLVRAQSWAQNSYLVALTGWGQEEDRLRSRAAGFDEHVVKPADIETIERICTTVQNGAVRRQ